MTPSAARDDRRPTLLALTGVRAFAACGPLILHAQGFVNALVPVARHGYLGIDLFFMLSGFVLAYVHGNEMRRVSWPVYGRFLALRLGRIWPAYIVMLLIVVVPLAWSQNWLADPLGDEPLTLVVHFLMLQTWGFTDPNHFNWAGWTVSAEWFVYLLFPLFVLALGRATRAAALIAIPLLIVALAIIFHVIGHKGVHYSGISGLLRIGFEFSVGILLWRLYRDVEVARWRWDWIGTAAGCLILLALAVFRGTAPTDYIFILLFAPLLLSLAYNRGVFARLCCWRPIVFFGEASYSIYLVHWWGLGQLFRLARAYGDHLPASTPGFVLLIPALLICILAGIALYFFVERPCRRWVRRRLGEAA